MHRYTVFGLNFASDIEFPHLLHGVGAGEFVIHVGPVAAQPPAELSNFVAAYWWSEESFFLRWTDVATCQIRGTDEIIVDIAPGAEMARVVQFVLGPAIGALLHLRGVFALHASAVEVGPQQAQRERQNPWHQLHEEGGEIQCRTQSLTQIPYIDASNPHHYTTRWGRAHQVVRRHPDRESRSSTTPWPALALGGFRKPPSAPASLLVIHSPDLARLDSIT